MADRRHGPQPSVLRQVASLAGAGVQFAVTVALCTAAGWWLDGRLGSSPWGLLAGAVVGGVAASYMIYRTLIDASDPSGPDSQRDTHKGEP